MDKFIALFDIHWGYEPRRGKLTPLHDHRAIDAVLSFAEDFEPDHVVLGGDALDCGPISHHRKGKVGELEGLRLMRDADELKANVISPLESIAGKKLIYHIGNHEDWLSDIENETPGLEGLLGVRRLLGLSRRWDVIPQGGLSKLGKLHFAHGDQVRSAANPAKWATEAWERSVRIGHFHTYSSYAKTSDLDSVGHTGIVVPCLCHRNPGYNLGAPNRWMSGFLWGYVDTKTGLFTDHVTTLVNGSFMANDTVY